MSGLFGLNQQNLKEKMRKNTRSYKEQEGRSFGKESKEELYNFITKNQNDCNSRTGVFTRTMTNSNQMPLSLNPAAGKEKNKLPSLRALGRIQTEPEQFTTKDVGVTPSDDIVANALATRK